MNVVVWCKDEREEFPFLGEIWPIKHAIGDKHRNLNPNTVFELVLLPRHLRTAPSTSDCCAALYHLLKVDYSMGLAQRRPSRSSVFSRRFMGARTRATCSLL